MLKPAMFACALVWAIAGAAEQAAAQPAAPQQAAPQQAAPQQAGAQTCQRYRDEAAKVLGETPADLAALAPLRVQVNNSQSCTEPEKTCFAHLIANAHAVRAGEMEEAGGALEEAEAVAKSGYEIAETWRASWTLAHFAERRKDYDRAALLYQLAMARLTDASGRIKANQERKESFVCPGEIEALPNAAQQDELRRLAVQMNALSQAFVRLPAARCAGEFSGMFAGQLGCTEIDRFSFPIEFQSNSANFTSKGREAARFLAEFVAKGRKQREKIVLTGHADRNGSDEHNCDLSRQRLTTLVRFLRQNGVGTGIAIEAIPQGKGEPFPIVEGSKFSDEEIDRINRRIELRDRLEDVVRKCPT